MSIRCRGRHWFSPIVAGLAIAVMASSAAGQTKSAPASALLGELATSTASDRLLRLIEGAKKEAELSIYTSAQADDLGAVTSAFEKKYGVKVQMWRASSEKVLQRVVTEARAGRATVDVIETNGPEMEALHREKLLQAVQSLYSADLIPQAIRPHGEWVATRLNVFVQAYNTKLIAKDDLPKQWEDLAQPRWKGKIGIEAEDSDWLSAVMGQLGESKGVPIFKSIVAANGIQIRRGHTLLAQLVAAGEVPLALTVYNYKAEQMKLKGATIDWFAIGPAIARPNGVGVVRRSPHPHAAVLFYEFIISPEGQAIIAGRDFVPTSRKIDSPFRRGPMSFIDPSAMLDQSSKWTKLYAELFSKSAGAR